MQLKTSDKGQSIPFVKPEIASDLVGTHNNIKQKKDNTKENHKKYGLIESLWRALIRPPNRILYSPS